MQYKTELHMHTNEVSVCAKLSAPEVAELYIAAGYHTVVVTNHYSSTTADAMGTNWSIDRYLKGYRVMKEYAKGRLTVLLGVELRFCENGNDYLLYGVTEEFLYEHPDLHLMKLKDFYPLAHENGILVIQAHPFRNGMTVCKTDLLDGIEVFNVNTLEFRNQIALEWARYFKLIPTTGSDLHSDRTHIGGGLLTDAPIESVGELVRVLKDRSATLIRERVTETGEVRRYPIPATLEK